MSIGSTSQTVVVTSSALPTNAAAEAGGNLASVKTNTDRIDIAISALRDAIVGAGPKTLTDIVTALGALAVTISSGSITVANGAGASAVNVQDGGNTLSVDDAGGSLTIDNANLDVALSTLATASAQTTGNNSLSSIKTNTDPLVTAGGGGYVRQDSTGTIAKESGGNLATLAGKDFATTAKQDTGNSSLATIATNTTSIATAAKQDTGNASLASIAGEDFATETTLALGATAANQTTGNASLASIAAEDFATEATLATLALAQGATATDQVGPLVQGVVNDSPQSYADTIVRPLSLTSEGRLRVSTVQADIGHVWASMPASPWSTDNPWEMEMEHIYV